METRLREKMFESVKGEYVIENLCMFRLIHSVERVTEVRMCQRSGRDSVVRMCPTFD